MIWIEPHIKGSGEVEQRVYSTLDQQELNLTAKIFEVERTIKQDESTIVKVQKRTINPIATQKVRVYAENYGFVEKIKKMWNNLFTSIFKKSVA